jgi:large subunit ribosomal protein L5e
MAFIKVQKSTAYFRRYQVKYRRRREGKTDYAARRTLTAQDKNKYNTPKYRFVARFTNSKVITQVIKATIEGDIVVAAATSLELARYGITFGLKNYAAAYATGLLCARRLLASLKLDKLYPGKEKATGEIYHVEEANEGPRPFKALLDVGLVKTSTGARVFGAMKGAVDGGLDIPHNEKRFPGYTKTEGKASFDPAVLRKAIYGGHVSNYMEQMKAKDNDKFTAHFSSFLKTGKKPSEIEALYTKAHAAIRADPSFKATTKKPKNTQFKPRQALSKQQRRARVAQKMAAKKAGNGNAGSDNDD